MPSIKQKFAGFFRQISNSGGGECLENANQMKPLHTSDSNTGCFIQRYLNGYGFVLEYFSVYFFSFILWRPN